MSNVRVIPAGKPKARPLGPKIDTDQPLQPIPKLKKEQIVNPMQIMKMFEEMKNMPIPVRMQNKDKFAKMHKYVEDDENNFYLCKICHCVAHEVKTCNKCDTVYCADCISLYMKDNNKFKPTCPIRGCENTVF